MRKGPRNFLDPAATVIEILGGAGKVAKRLGLHPSTVSQWRVPRERRGTGGLIPGWHHSDLLDFAEEEHKPLSADDLIQRPNARRRKHQQEPALTN